MCISSRQTSQGTQRIYTVNTTPLDRTRQTAYGSDSDDDFQRASTFQRAASPFQRGNLTIEIDDYEVSNDCMEDSPYLTRTATTVMRSISYVSSSDSEKSDSEKSDSEKSDSASEAEAEAEDDLTISP